MHCLLDGKSYEQITVSLFLCLQPLYSGRSLTEQPITPADQAEAVYFLLTRKSCKITGQIINVDGGLHEAFLR
ncbi:MAG: SDR family oxidoreductase [Planctomycetes bacterium]|nr:SDR family oxidoreductase [Planctomycetota bacterium]